MPRPQPFQRTMRALRVACRRQPVAEFPAQSLAVALQAVARQHGGPRPAGQDEGLGRDQRGQPARPLREQVVQIEPEPAGMPPRCLRMRVSEASGRKRLSEASGRKRLSEACGLVGGALERDVERMAGMSEGGVEAKRRDVDEALQLLGAHHGAGPVDGDERDQRAVLTDQRATASFQRHGRLWCQKTLQRLPPQRPAQALEVVGCCGERDPRAGEGHDVSVPSGSACPTASA